MTAPDNDDPIRIDKLLIQQRAIKTVMATAGTLAVAIPINVVIYFALNPMGWLPSDILASIGFVIGLVVGLNTGWNVGLKKGREIAARLESRRDRSA